MNQKAMINGREYTLFDILPFLDGGKVLLCEDENGKRAACSETLWRGHAPEDVHSAPVHAHSSSQEKIEYFLSVFKGRKDVYARRYHSTTTGKTGYTPVCKNEWVHGLCDKKKYRCAECPNREFRPLTADVVKAHLIGRDSLCRDVAAIYPMLEDNKTWLLAADFDAEDWKLDVTAFCESCKEAGLVPAVERSRSGNGAHVWFFFSEPVSAADARRLGTGLLTRTMSRRHALSFSSYDRLFPSQDIVPKGGFGNLIALPFQGQAQKNGNSLFVDDCFAPYPDQWAFLSSLPKITPEQLEEALRKLCHQGDMGELADTEKQQVPWKRKQTQTKLTRRDFPLQVSLHRSNLIYIEKKDFSQAALNMLKRLAAFLNPEFRAKQAMRISVYGIPRVLDCGYEDEEYIGLPRGCMETLLGLLGQHRTIWQEHSAKDFASYERDKRAGILYVFPPFIPARMGQKIGRRPQTQLCGDALDQYEVPVMLEDHRSTGHSIAVEFNGVLRPEQEPAARALLDADGHHPIIFMQCGPVRYLVDAKSQAEKRSFSHIVIPRFTRLRLPNANGFQDMYTGVIENHNRNELLVSDTLKVVQEGRAPILLTERKEHAVWLASCLSEQVKHVFLLIGSDKQKDKREKLAALQNVPGDEDMVVVATGKYIGEGFDSPRLDTLLLAMPISWKGTLAQYAGRLHRNYKGKQEVRIYDYVDIHVPTLERMYHKRLKGYAELGYQVKFGAADQSVSVIYDGHASMAPFEQDLDDAVRSVVIVSPYLQKGRIVKLLPSLQKAIASGVEIAIHTRTADSRELSNQESICEAIEVLEQAGMVVHTHKELNQRYAVVDEHIVWYGGVDFLAFGRKDTDVLRFKNPDIAGEFLALSGNAECKQLVMEDVSM